MSAHNRLPFLKHLGVGLRVAMANLLDGLPSILKHSSVAVMNLLRSHFPYPHVCSSSPARDVFLHMIK